MFACYKCARWVADGTQGEVCSAFTMSEDCEACTGLLVIKGKRRKIKHAFKVGDHVLLAGDPHTEMGWYVVSTPLSAKLLYGISRHSGNRMYAAEKQLRKYP